MAEFDPDTYFKNRVGLANMPKTTSVTQAMEVKLKRLREYQKAVAEGNALVDPERSVGDIAGDAAITAAKSAIGLTEGFVGLADIATGGAAGKVLENEDGLIGYRPKQAKELLDSWLSEGQKEANREVQMADGFVGTLEAAVENPSTILTTVGESAASMIGGAAIGRGALKAAQLAGKASKVSPVVAGAIGEGTLGAGTAAESIRQETADGLLTGKQTAAALASGVGTGVLGFAGGKLAQRMGLPDVDTMMTSGELKSPAGFLKAVLGAGISEGVFEEMPQSAQEQMWSNYALDKPLTEGVGESMAMGLLAGVAMGGVGGGVSGLAGMADGVKERMDASAKAKEAEKEAAKTGDVSALTKPGSATYAPDKAVDALLANASKEDVTPEVREQNLTKAQEVVAKLEAQRRIVASRTESPEAIMAKIETKKQELAALADPKSEEAEDLALDLEDLQSDLAKAQDPKARKQAQTKLAELDSQLNKAKESLKVLTDKTISPEVAQATVEQVKVGKADDVETQKAVTRVLSMAVNTPELLDLDTVKELASNKGNALNDDQRKYLSAFAESRAAIAALKDSEEVHQDVLYGGKGYVGISQYRDSIQNALKAQDRRSARRLMGQLSNFVAGHQSKAAAAAQAMKTGLGTPIAKVNGAWKVLPKGTREGQVPASEFKVMNSPKLVGYIQAEAKALNAALAEMQAAMSVFTPSNQTAGVSNVTNPPQQGSPKQEKQQAAKAGSTGEDGKAVSTELVDSGSAPAQKRATAVVESNGLNEASTQENSVLSVSTDSSESTETSVEQTGGADATDQATEISDGKLSGFTQEHPEGATASLSKHFTQTLKREGDKTGRPLVAVKDWISSLKNGQTKISDFVAGVSFEGEAGKAKERAVKAFVKQAKSWQAKIQANLPKTRKKLGWEHQDLMSILMTSEDGQLDLDENVKTAMAYAAFSYIAREAGSPVYASEKEMNKLLGRPEDWSVSPDAWELLGKAGSFEDLTADSLGAVVMDALGLKAKKDAPKNYESKLRAVLGKHVLELMVREGLVKRTTLPFAKLQALREEGLSDIEVAIARKKYGTPEENDRRVSHFVAIARDADGKTPVAGIKAIEEAIKGSGGVLDSLFKTQAGLVMPSFSPITTMDVSTGIAGQQAPKYLQEVILANQARPRKVRLKMLKIFGALDDSQKEAVIGVTEENPEFVHLVHETSVVAKNEGLRRQLNRFMDFVTNELEVQPEKLDTPFYLPFSVWQQHRVGIDSTVVNPQASKIVRYMITSPNWQTTVSSEDTKAMNSFWLRVGEGLGVKTERFVLDKALAEVQKKVAGKEIQAGVKALRSLVQGKDLNEQEAAAVVAAVEAGGESLHTMDVLLAMAEEAEAREQAQGKPYTFTVEMMGEVDGVANGTMFNHLLLGAKGTPEELAEMLEQGGFYTQDSRYRQYSDFRGDAGAGNLDIYESTLLKINERLQWAVDSDLLASIETIGGKLIDGSKIDRNLVKDALNPLAFGSSLTKMVNTMANGFVDKVYAGFEKLAQKGASDEEVLAYVREVNKLIGNPKLMLKEGMELKDYMGTRLLMQAEKNIATVYTTTIGEVVQEVIKTEFAAFLEKRDALVKASNTAYDLYNAVYEGVREVYVDELTQAGELELSAPNDKTGERKVIADLSRKQEEELARRLKSVAPVLKASMSLNETDTRSHILLMDETKGMSNDTLYQSETRFTGEDGKNRTATVKGMAISASNPGVKVVSAAAHSFDSGVSHRTQEKLDVLNIHDANGAGLGMMDEVASALNSNTWNDALNYSQMTEMYNALVSMVMRIRDNTRSSGMYPAVARNLESLFIAAKGEPKILQELRAIKGMAYEADLNKLTVMSQLASVDQYAYVGGNYVVTQEDREKAQQKLEVVKRTGSQLPDGVVKAVMEIAAAIEEGGVAAEAAAENSNPTIEEVQTTEEDSFVEQGQAEAQDLFVPKLSNGAAAQVLSAIGSETALQVLEKLKTAGTDLVKAMSDLSEEAASSLRTAIAAQLDAGKPEFWGKVGTPSVQPDAALVEFFESTTKPNVGQVIGFLEQHMKTLNQTRHVRFQSLLLEQLKRTADLDLPVQYITPSTPPSLAVSTPPSEARGWYVSNGEGIFVLSPDFAYSALTPEVLLHEMVHAALLEAVANPNKQTQGMVNELTRLYEKAKGFVESSGLKKHQAAVSELDEFIAWGLTNREFQADVLSKIDMGSRTKANKLITGMKEFINKVTGILFAGSSMSESEQARNGMAVLVSNVSGLFAEVAAQKEKQTKRKEDKAVARVLKMAANIRSYTTQELFDALNAGSISAGFQNHLNNLLQGMVTKLHGPAGALKASVMQNTTLSPLDTWLKALDTNEAPFAADVVSAGLANDSEQQAFVMEQVEATVRAALDGNEAQTKLVYAALNKLYTEAEKKISVQDFLAAGLTEDQYHFVFTPTKTNGDRSDYLSRFAAMGLAHEGFNKLMRFSTELQEKEAKTLGERLQRVFEQILDFFQRSLTGTWGGQRADVKLQVLATKLVDIEAARRQRLVKRAVHDSLFEPIEKGVQKGFDALREKAVKLSKNEMIRKNASGYVRGAGALVETIAGDRVDALLKTMQQLRDRELKSRHGILAGTLDQIVGFKDVLQALTRNKTNHDRKRKAIMNSTAKTVLESFANGGRDLSQKEKDSVTQVFLRTGLHHLVGTKSMQELETLLGKGKALDDAIEAAEQALTGFGKRAPYFMKQANVLGFYAATGKVADANMMMNAHNIAQMVGTPYHGQWGQDKVAAAVPLINQLVALYALRYTDSMKVSRAKGVLAKENARTDMNGVELVLKLHKQMEQESLDKLFKGNPSLMAFAYTPDIYNPHIGVTVADEQEGKELELQGYKKVNAVQVDPADPDQRPRHLYVLRDGGLQPYLAGAINMTGMKAKGSKLHSGYMNLKDPDGKENAQLHAAVVASPVRSASLKRMMQPGPVPDLSKVKTPFMAPVVNEKGAVVNWRYMMTQDSKDAILERTNGFDKVLGTLAGTTYDKATAAEQNREVMNVLLDLYKAEGEKHPHSYIEVSADSADAEMREIWAMLPKQTKEIVRQVWGKDAVMVRKDSLDLVFGYRKMSLSKAFEKDYFARNQLEKLLVHVVEYPMFLSYRKQGMEYHDAWNKAHARSKNVVIKGEHMWQELVREAKDIIVVKTGVVLLGNVISNLSLLWAQGVPLRDMLHHHLVAMRGATAYINDSDELARLKLLVESGMGGAEEEALRNQITRLEDSLARNPVGELIEAGLMPSIVEDVATEDDPYSYKSALVRKVDGYTKGWNKTVLSGARVAYMAHDTKLYQGLSRATQLSDFVARYTLYQHLMSQQDKAVSREEAIQEASEAFVNYDIPMHRVMQYMDDMGLMMFTKYFLRIQRVLMKLAKEHPARVLGMAAFNSFHDLGPIVLDSSAIFRIGNNPFSSGPLTLLESLDELATVTAPMALVK